MVEGLVRAEGVILLLEEFFFLEETMSGTSGKRGEHNEIVKFIIYKS